jgi:hypothetical protein
MSPPDVRVCRANDDDFDALRRYRGRDRPNRRSPVRWRYDDGPGISLRLREKLQRILPCIRMRPLRSGAPLQDVPLARLRSQKSRSASSCTSLPQRRNRAGGFVAVGAAATDSTTCSAPSGRRSVPTLLEVEPPAMQRRRVDVVGACPAERVPAG